MKLLIVNGSPKKAYSNTLALIEAFQKGLDKTTVDSHYIELAKSQGFKDVLDLLDGCSHMIIAFPLYGNAMPARLLELLETLDENQGILRHKSLGFIIQYGFEEAIHGRPIEGYLKEWTIDRGCQYIGSVVKGGCDSLAKSPKDKKNMKILSGINAIATSFSNKSYFDDNEMKGYSGIEKRKKGNRLVMMVIIKLMNLFYWKRLLKENGVSEKESFHKPYGI